MGNWENINHLVIRFYRQLNRFLPEIFRQLPLKHVFRGLPSIKHVIESLGVPHTEVDWKGIHYDNMVQCINQIKTCSDELQDQR